MAIPDYQTLMLPLLLIASDGENHYTHDVVDKLSKDFGLTEKERDELISSGTQTVISNRVGWAKSYLKQAGLLTYPKRSYFKITQRGVDLLNEKPESISNTFLTRYPEFVAFKQRKTQDPSAASKVFAKPVFDSHQTPEEEIETAYDQLRSALAEELLHTVIDTTPSFFEKLVVELLFKMGYGGTHRELARQIGQSGDEGIDGVIDQDKLGLDTIFIQAKRWQAQSTIGRPEIQRFVGALIGQYARRGVFITTAKFSKEARDYVGKIDAKVILIDGERLAELMIDYGVGVSLKTSYEIKAIDYDFFSDEAL